MSFYFYVTGVMKTPDLEKMLGTWERGTHSGPVLCELQKLWHFLYKYDTFYIKYNPTYCSFFKYLVSLLKCFISDFDLYMFFTFNYFQ